MASFSATTVEDSLKAAQDSGKSLIEKYEAKLEKHKVGLQSEHFSFSGTKSRLQTESVCYALDSCAQNCIL